LAFFSKTNVMMIYFQKLAVFWAKKRQYFCNIFRRKKIKKSWHRSGPRFGDFSPFGRLLTLSSS
jgi:hypothetical protein